MTNAKPKAELFEIKRFAVHDGPGIRTTFFFKGCPLSCIWCHNPEGISPQKEIAVLERKCVCCGECTRVCPKGLHVMGADGHTIRREDCDFCLKCVEACMPGALKFYGSEYAVSELLELALQDAEFYKESGGGVTCSGGEPMAQAAFLAEFLRECKNAGLHTAVDTSGLAPLEDFKLVAPFTDIFLYDIKHMDSARHRELCGVPNEPILGNIQALSGLGTEIEVRMPVIPGLNDSDDNLQKTAEFLRTIKTLSLIRPLPYHALSGTKYQSIGKPHAMPEATGGEKARAKHAAAVFAGFGLPVGEV